MPHDLKSENATPQNISMRSGIGNWKAFLQSGFSVDDIFASAREWSTALRGVEKPWLCWNVNADWCVVQQRLVESVGWTPVVGFDPRVGAPPLISGAVLIDFNKNFKFQVMYPHFPLDYVFLYAPRLAFWHSDLLIRPEKMKRFAGVFESLADGAMAAVRERAGLAGLLRPKELRYWELLGCMTSGASRSNFEHGCGWWLNFALHPKCPDEKERARRVAYHWECGVGIKYWRDHYDGRLTAIDQREVDEGHFTRINNKSYQVVSSSDWRRDLSRDLSANFELVDACAKLGLGKEFLANTKKTKV
jgi:hypothetical protein